MSGIMDILYIPLGWLIKLIYDGVGNYLAALLIFAVVVKLILFPLSIKQQKNSQKQARLRPRENAIRKKYAGRTDKATQTKMQEELMAMYQEEGFNPAGGCLPMLIQLPILLAVFRVVTEPLTYILRISKDSVKVLTELATKLAEAVGDKIDVLQINWIKIITDNADNPLVTDAFSGISDITVAELQKFYNNFEFFGTGINLLEKPILKEPSALWAIPILTFVLVYLSMKLTRKFTYQPSTGSAEQDAATASSMKIMDLMMPVMSTWFSFMYPAVIGIYWMMQNVLGFVQQYALYHMFPIPRFTEEEMKAAELALKGKTSKKKAAPAIEGVATEPQKKIPVKTQNGKKVVKNQKAHITQSALKRVRERGRVPMAKKKI